MDDKTYGEEKIKRESSNKLFIIIIILLIFVVSVIGISMAAFTYTKAGSKINTISTGNIHLEYTEDTNGINITNALPMTDSTGMSLTDVNQYFDFSVNAVLDGDFVASYEIAAEKIPSSTLDNNEVKLYLEKKVGGVYQEVMAPNNFEPLKNSTEIGTMAGSMLLDADTLNSSRTINYRLRMWVADDTVVSNYVKSFGVRVSIKARVDIAE